MKYTYDPLVDALLITFRKGKVAETKEITPLINADFDRNRDLLSIEILDAKKQFVKNRSKNQLFSLVPYSRKKIRELVL